MTLKVAGSKPVIHQFIKLLKARNGCVITLFIFGAVLISFTVQLLAYNVNLPIGNVNFMESK